MAVSVDSSTLDSDALPYHPSSHPQPLTVGQELLAIVTEELSTRRRISKKPTSRSSNLVLNIASSADDSASANDGNEIILDPSPFRQLLADNQAFDMWNQFVEMPEDQQTHLLNQLSSSQQSDNTPATPMQSNRISNRRRSELNSNECVSPTVLSNRKVSRRQRRRQRLDDDDDFNLMMFDMDFPLSPLQPNTPRLSSDRNRSSVPDMHLDSPVSSRPRRSTEAIQPFIRVMTVEAKFALYPPTAYHRLRVEQTQQPIHADTMSTHLRPPIWLQRLGPEDAISSQSWTCLKLFEEHIREFLGEDYKKTFELGVDALLFFDSKQMRMGLRLHNKDPLTNNLERFIHSMANYYQLSCDFEWTGRGKKKFLEGWVYLPTKIRKNSSCKFPEMKKKRSVPDAWFVDIASKYIEGLLC